MKHIELEELNRFLETIQPIPKQTIAHFCDDGIDMIARLRDFCVEREYEYRVLCTDSEFYETTKDLDGAVVKHFPLARPNYLQQGRFYDYLFVTSIVDSSMRESFLKKAHKSIKNSGYIVIFVPQGDYMEYDEWSRLLEEHYFVATSRIELFRHYDIIISKKMHGWGG